MLFIYGRRTARIKKFVYNQQSCKHCKAFDLEVKVYRDYYHLYYIPFIPIGGKTVRMRCRSCGEPLFSDVLQKEYEELSKTPFYLYSFPILIAVMIIAIVVTSEKAQKNKAEFVAKPQVGDVYTIRKPDSDTTTYYFLRVAEIRGDTVLTYHSNLEYYRYVMKFDETDYFVKDEQLYFLKSELKKMLENDEIHSVEREYGSKEGFNRIK